MTKQLRTDFNSVDEALELDDQKNDTLANMYFDKYPEQMQAFESSSILAHANESLSAMNVITMGRQLDQYSGYQNFVNENFSGLSSLGAIPKIALDVITAAVGNSILPLVSSIQPIQEEHGIVYYKQMRASQAAGGYQAGDVIRDPLKLDKLGDGTLGAQRLQVTVATGDGTTTAFAGQVASDAVRPYTIMVDVQGVGQGKDDGYGKILGFGFSGTINYKTGAIEINTVDALPADAKIQVIADIDVDRAKALPKIEAGLVTKDIRAEIWAIAADIGTFSNYAFAQRFGKSADDEVAADLANELTNTLNTRAVKTLAGMVTGAVTEWSKTPLTGTSYAEHKLTFVDQFAQAESVMHAQAGVGTAGRIIAGRTACATLRGLPEFRAAAVQPTTSIGLYGYYDGIPVIRATNLVADDSMFLLGNPDGYFNCPLAYSPFMPLIVTDTVQDSNNPFRGTKAAGVWAGMTPINNNLVVGLNITA